MNLKRPLRGNETGADVRMVQRALNRWARNPETALTVTKVYDAPTLARMQAFQLEQGIQPMTGYTGQKSLDKLDPYFDEFGRQGYMRFQLAPVVPPLGPIVEGGVSVLDHACTHLTDVLGWPAFDDGWRVGRAVIAPEPVVVYDNTSSSQGGDAFYVKGESGIRWWFAHITTVPRLNAEFAKGTTMTRISSDHPRPHVHAALNVVPLIGKHLISHDDYTLGAPLIRRQLKDALA